MHADIPAIRALAAEQSRHAADLDDVAARLAAVAPSTEAFGPVGGPFLAALSESVARAARMAADLGEQLATAGASAAAAASAYADSEWRSGHAIGSIGV